MHHNVQAVRIMELVCISEAYGKGWLASRSGLSHLPYNGVAWWQGNQLMSLHVEWHDDKGTSLCPFTWSGMMTREPSYVPSRGVAWWQGNHLMSPHVEWHDDKGTSLCPFTWSGMMTREPANVSSRGVAWWQESSSCCLLVLWHDDKRDTSTMFSPHLKLFNNILSRVI
jgi:hypothetical protein